MGVDVEMKKGMGGVIDEGMGCVGEIEKVGEIDGEEEVV